MAQLPYVKLYEPEEIDELLAWYREHLDTLPPSIRITCGMFVPDVRKMVINFIEFCEINRENPTYSAQIRLFFTLRDRLVNGEESEADWKQV